MPGWVLKLWVLFRLGVRVLVPNHPVAAQFHLPPPVRWSGFCFGGWKGLLAVPPTEEPWEELLVQGWSQGRMQAGDFLVLVPNPCEMIRGDVLHPLHP